MKASFPEAGKLGHLFKCIRLLKRNGLLEEYQNAAGKADIATFTSIKRCLRQWSCLQFNFREQCFISLSFPSLDADSSELVVPFSCDP